jgi:hypothetical protein
MKAYEAGGGNWRDFDKLKMSSITGLGGLSLGDDFAAAIIFDPLGYMADVASTDGEIVELTSELLADAIRLAHPDCHPPVRQDLARRVTQGLLALQPFVFPAPKPKPTPLTPSSEPRYESPKAPHGIPKDPSRQACPCNDCRSTVPYFYCTVCRTEWDKRQQIERERQNLKQRARYAERKSVELYRTAPTICSVCTQKFKGKRKDARFCSDACRQRAHRQAVTAISRRKLLPRNSCDILHPASEPASANDARVTPWLAENSGN